LLILSGGEKRKKRDENLRPTSRPEMKSVSASSEGSWERGGGKTPPWFDDRAREGGKKRGRERNFSYLLDEVTLRKGGTAIC